jgi:23S rRNA (adenine2503-C2)-methyltransferase
MVKMKLCGLTAYEMLDLVEPYGYNRSHAVSIANSIYKRAVSDIYQIEKIPLRLKTELFNIASTGIILPLECEVSADKSVKYLFRTESGNEFETVYIPDKRRNTVCVSTQSGCRMGCSFCVTGRYGFRGNLTAGEIVNQIVSLPYADKVTHVVFMGMGEPMDNLENVLKACNIITAEWGLAVSSRNVTVSTVGVMPGVDQFLQKTNCNLTLSLYSPFSDERKKMIPMENRYPVQQIIEIMKKFPLKKRRRLSIAYIMIKDLNDTESHLNGLIYLLKGSQIRVNLLPYHQWISDKNCPSPLEWMQFFKHRLIISGISASIRKSRGVDISAACGLLASGLKQ